MEPLWREDVGDGESAGLVRILGTLNYVWLRGVYGMSLKIFSKLFQVLGFKGVSVMSKELNSSSTAKPLGKHADALPSATRKEQRIRCSADLIPKLKKEHQDLIEVFGKLPAACNRADYQALPEMIQSLKLGLQYHLIVENVRLYAYLQQELPEASEQAKFVNNIKREMDGIARSVVRFAATYSTPDAIEKNVEAFRSELDSMGDVLLKRIELEETRLYALYT